MNAANAPERATAMSERCAAAVLDTVPSIMDALRGAMRRHVGEQLSVPQYRCLNFIAREPGSSLSAVAAFMGVTLPTASALVDRLVRAGALQTVPSSEDRRRSCLTITSAGQAQLQRIWLSARDDLALMLKRQPATELNDLLHGLQLMSKAFGIAPANEPLEPSAEPTARAKVKAKVSAKPQGTTQRPPRAPAMPAKAGIHASRQQPRRIVAQGKA